MMTHTGMTRSGMRRLTILATLIGITVACVLTIVPSFRAHSETTTLDWPAYNDSNWLFTDTGTKTPATNGSTVQYQVKNNVLYMQPYVSNATSDADEDSASGTFSLTSTSLPHGDCSKISSTHYNSYVFRHIASRTGISVSGSTSTHSPITTIAIRGTIGYPKMNSAGQSIFVAMDQEFMAPDGSTAMSGYGKLTDISGLSHLDVDNVNSLSRTFKGNSDLTNLKGLENWDVSHVKNLDATFSQCAGSSSTSSGLSDISALSNWNTSAATTMASLFSGDTELTDNSLTALAKWDTSNVTSLAHTFSNDSAVTSLTSLAGWNIKNVTTLEGTFARMDLLSDISALAKWNTAPSSTASVTTLESTFDNDPKLTNIDALSGWDTSNVTNMTQLFANDTDLHDLSALTSWDLSSLTSTSGMFTKVDWFKIGIPAKSLGGEKFWVTSATDASNATNIDACQHYTGVF